MLKVDVVDGSPTDLRQALREADWNALLPNLVGYARRRLRRAGWAAGRDSEPSALSVEELVHTAIERCLDGTRRWDPAAVDLGGLLRGVIRSLVSAERKRVVRAKTLTSSEIDERHAEPIGPPEDDAATEEGRAEILAACEACVAGDGDLEALYRAVIDGATTREALAAELCWTADRVSVVRRKLQRRLARSAPETLAAARQRMTS